MDSIVFSVSFILVASMMCKAETVKASMGKLHQKRSQGAVLHSMVFDIKENSANEKQFVDRILSLANAKVHSTHASLSNNAKMMNQRSQRKRKSIFGIDNRISVGTSIQAQMYPYSTVVTLSSGCTGTLIGAQHVLTAAHCVHNGKKFIKRSRKLKIGMLQRNGAFRWIKVSRIHLPKQWLRISTKERVKHDYAVLKLKRPHRRPIMAIKASDLKRGSTMRFAGFHGDKVSNTMWYSQCPVMGVISGAVLSHCDGAKGISGSGVRSDNAVVGVVSAIGTGRYRGRSLEFNVVITLTPRKVRRILRWMKRGNKKRRIRARRKKAHQ
ncbi:serine protease 23 [Exaiptasia diaphana]|uniref:Peptidase S1 domain-containing protein n=1 Tax=Exaiptasia diaphana TaxID=2652724 RepID=A0A913WPN8_EXADI|nr:serine protease 23 [Exaiptasia diaphana]XP_020892200.1 serine protease 23 [Exaiptasia diaphana]XP_020892201.1 serine protease 23 [Exaiptasia diaphana]XP_028512602.1 serine protease 23 [Exaiptasia diaphana]KXJ28190.1 Serine protease 23 [Exaiptasia diaphana]